MALLFCLGTFISRQACAQKPQLIELEEQPSGCFEREQLEAEVLAELGPTEVPARLHVQANLGKPSGFVLWDGDEVVAERQFESLPPDCAAQLRMLAVVIALAIEHKVSSDQDASHSAVEEKSLETLPKASGTPPSSEPKSEILPEQEEPKSQQREKPKSWALRGAAGVGYSFGVLPVPAPLVTAELGVVVWRGWSAEVGLIVSDQMRIGFEVEQPEGRGSRVVDEAFSQAIGQLIGGKAQGCWERFFEKGAMGLCGGLAAGRFHARGVEGFQPNPGEGVPWFAGFSRFTARAPARGPFGAALNADIFANFLRPGVELTGEGSAKSPLDTPVAGGVVSLGMFFVVQ
jgi:hypothetical protein